MMDENDRYQEYFDYFSDQLSMDLLKKDYPYDSEMLDNILELIVETVCTKRPLIRIGAEERPAEIVRSRFMKLNAEHIRYVMDCFKENTTKIRNIRQYMLTTIYNAPTTIDTYYDALVRHDMSHGYVGRAEEYEAAKSALLEGLGLEHLFDHSHELTPKEKEIWMLFDRVYVAELLARDAFAKGAYMLGAEDREIMLK